MSNEPLNVQNPRRIALAVAIASVVCSEGDSERFFENLKCLREGQLRDFPEVCRRIVELEELVLLLNETIQRNPETQEF